MPKCENCGQHPVRMADLQYRQSKEARGEYDPFMIVCEDCDQNKLPGGRRPNRKKKKVEDPQDRTNYRIGNRRAEERRKYFMLLYDIDRMAFFKRFGIDPEQAGAVVTDRHPLKWITNLPMQAIVDINNKSIAIRNKAYPLFYTDAEPEAVAEALASLRTLLGTYQFMATIPHAGVAEPVRPHV